MLFHEHLNNIKIRKPVELESYIGFVAHIFAITISCNVRRHFEKNVYRLILMNEYIIHWAIKRKLNFARDN